MLRLHHSPVACSLASRLALIEAGLPHEVVFVKTWKGETKSEAYRAINPRGKVPVLETDKGILTESTAILPYIADLAPQKKLLPPAGTFERAVAQSWLSFFSSTLHASLSSALFVSPGCDNDIAREAALARVAAAFGDIDAHLTGRDHVLDAFSVCDLYLVVFATWRVAPTLSGRLPTFANVDRFQQAILSRPGLMAVVGEEMKLRAEA